MLKLLPAFPRCSKQYRQAALQASVTTTSAAKTRGKYMDETGRLAIIMVRKAVGYIPHLGLGRNYTRRRQVCHRYNQPQLPEYT